MSEVQLVEVAVDLVARADDRRLTATRFQGLAEVPPELEWFANIDNKSTRRAYENALHDFMGFAGVWQPGEFRIVTRSHVIAWRDDLVARGLSGMTVRHRLAALSSLFEHLCERNAVTHNPVKGVKRPPVESYEGKTPATRRPPGASAARCTGREFAQGQEGSGDSGHPALSRAGREELCTLTVKDFRHERRGVAHLKVFGKGSKTRYVPLHPAAGGLIVDYLEADGRGEDAGGALFRAPSRGGQQVGQGHHGYYAVYKIVRGYSARLGFEIGRASSLRATAATNALDHQAEDALPRCRSGSGTSSSATDVMSTATGDNQRLRRTALEVQANQSNCSAELSLAFMMLELLRLMNLDRDRTLSLLARSRRVC